MTPSSRADSERRILVLAAVDRRRTLADLSVFESLTAAGAQVIVVCHADQAALLDPTLLELRLRHTPDQLEVPLSLTRDSVSSETLRRWRCDEALLLDSGLGALRLASAAGAGRRWGIATGLGRWWLTDRVDRRSVDDPSHATDNRESLIEAMGIEWRRRQLLHQPASWSKSAEERLRKAKLDPKGPLVGVYLGGNSRRQRWPAKRFTSFVQSLRRAQPSWQLVLISTDDELWASVQVHESTGRIVPVIGPDMAIHGIAAVIAALDLMIAADSFVLDLAAVLGVRRMGLFGSKPATIIDFRDDEVALVERSLSSLSVERVLAAVPSLSP